MKVQITRWPMCGGGLAYAVRVLVKDAPAFMRTRTPKGSNSYITRVISDGQEFFDFENITTEEHHDMEPGLEKWDEWKAHEKAARARMLALIQSVFPETRKLTEWPLLWATGLMSKEDECKATAEEWVEA